MNRIAVVLFEPTLFKLADAYEQVAKNRKPPASTPALPGEHFSY